MSIEVQQIGRSGFGGIPIYSESSSENPSESSSSSSSSSSIGKNSDSWRSDGQDSSEEKEVESVYKGSVVSPDSLEEALPIRRGISSCYQGKSKSFTSLLDATTSCKSAKDFAKPDNAYSRRRRIELAKKMFLKSTDNVLRIGGGISKKAPTGQSTLALAVAKNDGKRQGKRYQKQNRHLRPQYPSVRTSVDHSLNISSSTSSLSLSDIEDDNGCSR